MKIRIIASIIVILVVGALFLLSELGQDSGTPVINQPSSNDAALKALSL